MEKVELPERGIFLSPPSTPPPASPIPKESQQTSRSAPALSLHRLVTSAPLKHIASLQSLVIKTHAMSKFLPADNLPSWLPIHDFADPVYNYKTGAELLDTTKTSLWTFVAMTAFNPIFWNIVARNGVLVGA